MLQEKGGSDFDEQKGRGWFLVIPWDDPPFARTEQRPVTKPKTFYTPRHFVTQRGYETNNEVK